MRSLCVLVFLFALVVACAAEGVADLDWAAEVTGNPWDMEGREDIRMVLPGLQLRGVQGGVASFRGRGSTVYLSMRGHLLDGNRYNEVRIRARASAPTSVRVTCVPALNPYYPSSGGRFTSQGKQVGAEWTTVEVPLPTPGSGEHPAVTMAQELGLIFSAQGNAEIELDFVEVLRDASAPSQAESPPPYQDYRHATDPLPELDMRFVEEPLFSFAVFTDPHFSTNEGPRERKQRELVKQINALGPDFVLNLGDTITVSPWSPGYRGSAEMAKRILGEFKMPLYYVPGNHDVGNKPSFVLNQKEGFGNKGLTDETIEEYVKLFDAPTYYSFDHKGYHFAYIDTMGLGSDTSDGKAQMEWLRKDLAGAQDKRFRFLFAHVHPMYKELSEPGEINYDAVDQPYRKELLDLCEEHNVEMLMCGHTHHFFFNRYGGTRLFTLASSGFPRWARWHLSGDPDFKLCYAVVRVYEDRYEVNVVRIPEPSLYPRKVQEENEFPARQVVTEQSDEHRFPAAGANADLVTEDLLAWSQGNLNDGLTVYPGMRGGDSVAGVSWSSQPTNSPEDEVVILADLAEPRQVVEVRAIGVQGEALPGITAKLTTETGEEVSDKRLVLEPGGDALVARFEGEMVSQVLLKVGDLPAESGSRDSYSAQLAEIEVIDSAGRNVALKEYGTMVMASSNRTVRPSGVYNSNPIFTDERQWYFLRDLGVNIVRVEPDSIASRMVKRDGKLVLNPPTRALLEEGAESGIAHVLRLEADMESPSGARAEEIARYLASELREPKFAIEVDGSTKDMLALAKAVQDGSPGRKVILGGLRPEDLAGLGGFQELLNLTGGICVDVDCDHGAKDMIASVKSSVEALSKDAGAPLRKYLNVQGGPTSPDEQAWLLTEWTIEAATRDVTLMWWHATEGERPFFAFFRGEEPTLPAYALRLLATIVPADPVVMPADEIVEGVPGVEVRCIGSSNRGEGPILIVMLPAKGEPAAEKFDLRTRLAGPGATFIDVVAGTAQDARVAIEPTGVVIPDIVWSGRPILLRIAGGRM